MLFNPCPCCSIRTIESSSSSSSSSTFSGINGISFGKYNLNFTFNFFLSLKLLSKY